MPAFNLLSGLVPSTGLAGPFSNLLTTATDYIQTFLNSSFASPPQYFNTVPFSNNAPCLYQIALANGPNLGATTVIAPDDIYTFPLTPAGLSYQSANMATYFDVRGDSDSYGVQRIIDIYGMSPPIITINGTTGFQFHSLDGYRWSGRISMYRLQKIIQDYHQRYATSITNNDPNSRPTMLFFDGFTGGAYEVVPIGPFVDTMDANRPILKFYNLQFIVARDLSLPPQEYVDPLSLALIKLQGTIVTGFRTVLSGIEQDLLNTVLGSTGIYNINPPFPSPNGP